MNRQIAHVMALVVLLFALLVGFTSRWTVFEAESLESNTANRRDLLEQQRVPRGLIVASDGSRIAANESRGSGNARVFRRVYPQGELFSHPIGYSFLERGRAGLEQARNEALSGETGDLESIFGDLTASEQGDDVRSTLDPAAQRLALQRLGGRKGAVVALEPRTGRVRVMVSVPTFDPGVVDGPRFGELLRDEDDPLVNRATQATYPPGSTFKVVTAAAALDTGEFRPDSIVNGDSPKVISGVPLQNFGNQDFGAITLTDAMTNSVNTVFAQVGVKLGRGTLVRYMKRFGFYEDPPLDYPDEQLAPSGVFERGGDLVTEGFDVGRVAIGQGGAEGQIRATPLQMAMVAAAIGNGGKLMEPRLTERIVAPDGRVLERVEREEASEVMKEATAAKLAGMMNNVVQEGSGTAAALQGVNVAGKTGTAEVDAGTANQAWFIAFAPVDDPKMAIAVTVERTQGQGGTVAAPIAKEVLQELLG